MLQVAKSHSCSDGVVQSVSHKRTCVTPSEFRIASGAYASSLWKPEAENSQFANLNDMAGTGAFLFKRWPTAQVQSSRGHQMWYGGGAHDASMKYCEDCEVYKDLENSRKHERKILWSLVPWHRTTLHERPFVHLPCWRNCFSDAEKSFLGPTSWAPAVSLAFLFVSNVFWAWACSWVMALPTEVRASAAVPVQG